MDRLSFVLILLLGACGGAPQARTAQSVVDAISASGIQLSGVEPGVREEGTPLPNSYTDWVTFEMAEVAPRGGQVFICDTKQNCDAVVAYFDMFKGLVGPYVFQSADGLAVVQLNSGLSADTGAKVKAVIDNLE